MWKNESDDDGLALKGYLNLMTNLAKAFVILSLAMLSLANLHKADTDGIRPNAQYVIQLDWEDGTDSDVDIYVQAPTGDIIYYQNKSKGLVNLDRDDTGSSNNKIIINGQEIINRQRTEMVAIRGIIPGQFIINLHLFREGEKLVTQERTSPTTAQKVGVPIVSPHHPKVQVIKLNPAVDVVWSGSVTLDKTSQEVHVVRFTMKPDGNIVDITTDLPTSLVKIRAQAGTFVPPQGTQ